MIDKLMSLREVCAALGGLNRATVYRMVQHGELPPPVKMGERSAWPESEVAALIERRKAARIMGQTAGQPAKAA